MYPFRYFAVSGGLMSYGADLRDIFRRAAAYVDHILKGTRPGDLPVQAPTWLELVMNLNAAKALGITMPPLLLARADEVIERSGASSSRCSAVRRQCGRSLSAGNSRPCRWSGT